MGNQVDAELRNVGNTSYTAASFIVPETKPLFSPFSYRVAWDNIENLYWVLLRGSPHSIDFEKFIGVPINHDASSSQMTTQGQHGRATDAEVEAPSHDAHELNGSDMSHGDKEISLDKASAFDATDIDDVAITLLQPAEAALEDLGYHRVKKGDNQMEHTQNSEILISSPSSAVDATRVDLHGFPESREYTDELLRLHSTIDLQHPGSGDLYEHSKSLIENLSLDDSHLPEYFPHQGSMSDVEVAYVIMDPDDRRRLDEANATITNFRVSHGETISALQSKRPDGFEWLKDYDADPRKRKDWAGLDTVFEAQSQWQVPVIHHKNLLGRPVESKHQTLPQTSAWAYFAEKARHYFSCTQPNPFSCKAVTRAQAWKWIDPFIYCGLLIAVSCEVQRPKTN